MCLVVFWFVLSSMLQAFVLSPPRFWHQTAASSCGVCLQSFADKHYSIHNLSELFFSLSMNISLSGSNDILESQPLGYLQHYTSINQTQSNQQAGLNIKETLPSTIQQGAYLWCTMYLCYRCDNLKAYIFIHYFHLHYRHH